jgi:hypothetical protein
MPDRSHRSGAAMEIALIGGKGDGRVPGASAPVFDSVLALLIRLLLRLLVAALFGGPPKPAAVEARQRTSRYGLVFGADRLKPTK